MTDRGDEMKDRGEMKGRSSGSKLLEFLFWAALSVAIAVILVSLSERLLPTNF